MVGFKSLGFQAGFLSAFFGLLSCSSEDEEQTPIVIGFVESLSGESAFVTSELEQAATLAAKGINDAGGIDGREVEIRTRDNQGDIEKTEALTQELIDEGVQYLISGTSGDHLNAMADLTVPSERLVLTGLPYGDSYNGEHRKGLLIRTSTIGDGYVRAWTSQIASEHNRILVVDRESELDLDSSVVNKIISQLKEDGCGDDSCELSIVSHPDDADASYDWSVLADEANQHSATAIVYLQLDTDLFLQTVQESSHFEGEWHMQPHHSFAPLDLVLEAAQLQQLRWASLAIPASPSSTELGALLGVDENEINPAAAATYDLVVLLGLAMSRAVSLSGSDVGSAMRDVSRGPGTKIHSIDLEKALSDPGLSIDYFGASGPVDLNDAGDVLAPGVVIQAYDEEGGVIDLE